MKTDYQPGQQLLKQIQQEAREKGYETWMKNIFYFPPSLPLEIIHSSKFCSNAFSFEKAYLISQLEKLFLPILCSNNTPLMTKFISWPSPLLSTCGCNKHLKFIMAKQQSPLPLTQTHCFPSQEKETAIHQKAWAKSSYLTFLSSPPVPHLILQPAPPSKEIWDLSTFHSILFTATTLVQATVCWPGSSTTDGWCMGGQIIR